MHNEGGPPPAAWYALLRQWRDAVSTALTQGRELRQTVSDGDIRDRLSRAGQHLLDALDQMEGV